MKIEFIAIGDELLLGQTIDSNKHFIGSILNTIGLRLNRTSTIGDQKEDIINELISAQSRSNLVIITGGLGPTNDDITKDTLCDYFDSKLVLNTDILEFIEQDFRKSEQFVTESTKKQALLPNNCKIIRNYHGTASGMWFKKDGVDFISLPGVPYEVRHIFERELLTLLENKYKRKSTYHKTIITANIEESQLSEIIKDWEDDLIKNDIKLAYLPSPGLVKLRLTSEKFEIDYISKKIEELHQIIPQYFVYEGDSTLPKIISNLFKKLKIKLGISESCTGGYLSYLITNIPGASYFYEGSIVCYSYDIKEKFLKIPKEVIHKRGVVSREVVELLSQNTLNDLNVDYSISISGIAGPDGGTSEKPVGTVWISVRSKNKQISKRYVFGNNRDYNITQSSITALLMLYNLVMEERVYNN